MTDPLAIYHRTRALRRWFASALEGESREELLDRLAKVPDQGSLQLETERVGARAQLRFHLRQSDPKGLWEASGAAEGATEGELLGREVVERAMDDLLTALWVEAQVRGGRPLRSLEGAPLLSGPRGAERAARGDELERLCAYSECLHHVDPLVGACDPCLSSWRLRRSAAERTGATMLWAASGEAAMGVETWRWVFASPEELETARQTLEGLIGAHAVSVEPAAGLVEVRGTRVELARIPARLAGRAMRTEHG